MNKKWPKGDDFEAVIDYPTENFNKYDYSFVEMGVYDLPPVLDKITSVTGRPKVTYIGYSHGTT